MAARASTGVLTGAALAGFAANSLLCRSALGPRSIDAATFTTVRIVAGALTLAVLVRARSSRVERARGTWTSAVALFLYAILFSLAYVRIGAGVGALLLFGAVQATMVGWGLVSGERPRPAEWIGLAAAIGGLVFLTFPGLQAPDAAGAASMIAAGVGWGAYSIRGRGVADPLGVTADNFARCVPFALATSVVAAAGAHGSPGGVLLAAASGALASGIGYSFWYAALGGMTATRAAIVQLAVPVLAAAGGVVLLAEPVTPRLVGAGAAIVGGVAVAVIGRSR
jgi:drug/metabolite transporter (DMT)-like permease